MSRPTIEITVSPEGKSQVQTKGFRGTACRLASLFLEKALGRRTSETLTAEFHQQESLEERQHEQS